MKKALNAKNLRDHMTYSWWKYALLLVCAWMFFSIYFTTTAYRPPEEKKVVLGIYGYGNDTYASAYMEQLRQEHLPDMEEVTATLIIPDEAYGEMILTTRFAARECDVYVIPRTQFQNYTQQGAFKPLDVVLPDLVADLKEADVSLSRGTLKTEASDEKHVYGIPCQELPGLQNFVYGDLSDLYLCVFYETGNDENVLKFTDIFVRDMLAAPDAGEAPAATDAGSV